MTPEIYSLLRRQVDHIIAAGGDVEEAMRCARTYLELERSSKAGSRSRVENLNEYRQRNRRQSGRPVS